VINLGGQSAFTLACAVCLPFWPLISDIAIFRQLLGNVPVSTMRCQYFFTGVARAKEQHVVVVLHVSCREA
jgi:hypothetical protein